MNQPNFKFSLIAENYDCDLYVIEAMKLQNNYQKMMVVF